MIQISGLQKAKSRHQLSKLEGKQTKFSENQTQSSNIRREISTETDEKTKTPHDADTLDSTDHNVPWSGNDTPATKTKNLRFMETELPFIIAIRDTEEADQSPSIIPESTVQSSLFDISDPRDTVCIKSATQSDASDIVIKTEIKEDQQEYNDGTVVKTRKVIKRFYKLITGTTVDEIRMETNVDQVIRTDIDEDVLVMAPGITEPFPKNAAISETTEKFEDVMPNGSIVKRNIHRTVVNFKTPIIEEYESDATSPTMECFKTFKITEQSADEILEVSDVEPIRINDNDVLPAKLLQNQEICYKPILRLCQDEMLEDSRATSLNMSIPKDKSGENVLDQEMAATDEIEIRQEPSYSSPSLDSTGTETLRIARTTEPSPTLKVDLNNVTLSVHQDETKQKHISPMVASHEIQPLETLPPSDNQAIPIDTGKMFSTKTIPNQQTKRSVGDIFVKTNVSEDEQRQNDGRLTKTRITTKTTVKPVCDIIFLDNVEKETHEFEEIVSTDIEENVVVYAPGITEPFPDNVEIFSQSESFSSVSADGSPLRRFVKKTVVEYKISFTDQKSIESALLDNSKIEEVRETSPVETVPSPKLAKFPSNVTDLLSTIIPNVPMSKRSEGEIIVRTDVTTFEQRKDDGSLIKSKITTKTSIKPVCDIIFMENVEKERHEFEQVVATDIEENIVVLAPGITEPFPDNVEISRKTESFSSVSPDDGSVLRRNVEKTLVDFKIPVDGKEELMIVSPSQASPKIPQVIDPSTSDISPSEIKELPIDVSDVISTKTLPDEQKSKISEGTVIVKTDVREVEQRQDDGSLIKTKITTKTSVKPVCEIVYVGNVEKERHEFEKVVAIDIEENIVVLAPGITEPFPDNVEFSRKTESFSSVSPDDGSVLRRNVQKTTVDFKIPVDGEDKSTMVSPSQTSPEIPQVTDASAIDFLPSDVKEIPIDVADVLSTITLPSEQKSKISEGTVIVKTDVREVEQRQNDGSLIKTKITTKTSVKPVCEIVYVDNVEKERHEFEKVVAIDIVENIVVLAPGITEPFPDNVEFSRKTESFSSVSPDDGSVLRRNVQKTTVDFKIPIDGEDKSTIASPSQTSPEIPQVTDASAIDILPSDVKEIPIDVADVLSTITLPSEQKSKISEGTVIVKTDVREVEQRQDDGSLIKTKITTKTSVKPVCEIVYVGNVEKERHEFEKVVATDIEENIVVLAPGITEPFPDNVEISRKTESFSSVSPDDGSVLRRNVQKTTVDFKIPVDGEDKSTIVSPSQASPKILQVNDPSAIDLFPSEIKELPIHVSDVLSTKTLPDEQKSKISEGTVIVKTDVREVEQRQDDGSLIKTKITTKTSVKPVCEIVYVDNVEKERHEFEKVVATDIEENIVVLAPGITEPFPDNVEISRKTESFSSVSPDDGSVLRRNVQKTTVDFKIPVDGEDKSSIVSPSQASPKIPHVTDPSAIDLFPSEIKELPIDVSDVISTKTLPDEQKSKISEGTVIVKTDVREVEQRQDDGSLIKTKITTKTSVKPVCEIVYVDNVEKERHEFEKVVATDIEENIVVLAPGITEPFPDNVEFSRKTESFSSVSPDDGSVLRRNVQKTTVDFKIPVDGEDKGTIVSPSQTSPEIPQVTDASAIDILPSDVKEIPIDVADVLSTITLPSEQKSKISEGTVIVKTDVREVEQRQDDGSLIKTKITTKTSVKPVCEIVYVDNVEKERHEFEKVVATDIEENIVVLAPGITEPFPDNVEISRKTESFSSVSPDDGSVLRRNVQKTTVDFKIPVDGEDKSTIVSPSQAYPKIPHVTDPSAIDLFPSEIKELPIDVSDVISTKTLPDEQKSKISEGTVIVKTDVREVEQRQDDGSLIKTKITTKTSVKPVSEIVYVDNVEKERHEFEKVVATDIEENIVVLAPGITEPFPDNVEISRKTESFSSVSPDDGSVLRRNVQKTTVDFKIPVDGEDKSTIVSPSQAYPKIPHVTDPSAIDLFHSEIKELPIDVSDVMSTKTLPDEQKSKISEGTVIVKTDVREVEQRQDDGSLIKTKITTKTSVKPVCEIVYVGNVEKERHEFEKVVATDIEENIVVLAPGITEPFPDNVEISRKTESFSSVSPDDGSVLRRNVQKTTVDFKIPVDGEDKSTIVSPSQAYPKIPHVTDPSAIDLFPSEIKELPIDVSDVISTKTLPDEQKSKISEGTVIVKTDVREVEQRQDDGSLIKTKITTKTSVKPVCEIVYVDNVEKERHEFEKVVATDIEENIVVLAPGITEPFPDNVEFSRKTESFSSVSPDDGSVLRRNVQKTTVDFKIPVDGEDKSTIASPLQTSPEIPQVTDASAIDFLPSDVKEIPIDVADVLSTITLPSEQKSKISEGTVIVKTDVREVEQRQDDGSLIKTKITTKTSVKPVCEIVYVGNVEKERHKFEKVVATDIEEKIVVLAPGITEPFPDNVEISRKTESFSSVSPDDGSVLRRNVQKTTVDFKIPVDGEDKSTIVSPSQAYPKIPHVTDPSAIDLFHSEIKELPIDVSDVMSTKTLPDEQKSKISEGTVIVKTDVREVEQRQDDGSLIKTKITTKTSVKPVCEIVYVDNVEKERHEFEKVVATDIEENIVVLAPGITEPFPDNVEFSRKTESFSSVSPDDGSVLRRNVQKTTVDFKIPIDGEDKSTIASPSQTSPEIPQVTDASAIDFLPSDVKEIPIDVADVLSTITLPSEQKSKISEGTVIVKTDVREVEQRQDDGSLIKTKITTKTSVKPVCEIVYVGNVEKERHEFEKVVATDIEENIVVLAPGITEPFPDNVEISRKTESFSSVSPDDGSVLKRNVQKTTVDFKIPVDGEDKSTIVSPSQASPKIPQVTDPSAIDLSPSEIKELPIDVGDVLSTITLPREQKSKLSEGTVIVKTDVREVEQRQDDGSLIKTKITTKTSVKPVCEIIYVGSVEKERHEFEKVVATDIEENIVVLAPGITEPFPDNVEISHKTESFSSVLPDDGSVLRRTVKKTSVNFKISGDDEREIGALSSSQSSKTEDIQTDVANESKNILSNLQISRRFVGELATKTDVKDVEQKQNDGSFVKTRVTTKTSVIPVCEIIYVGNGEKERHEFEEIVATDIKENIVVLAPGITEPFPDNVVIASKTESFSSVLPDGSVLRRDINRTNVDFKIESDREGKNLIDSLACLSITEPSPLEFVPSEIKEIPTVVAEEHSSKTLSSEQVCKRTEGNIAVKTDVKEVKQTKSDGSLIKTTIKTKTSLQPICEIIYVGNVEKERHEFEKVVSTDIEENIVVLAPGITEPFPDNVVISSESDIMDSVSLDGSHVRRNISKTFVNYPFNEEDQSDMKSPSSVSSKLSVVTEKSDHSIYSSIRL